MYVRFFKKFYVFPSLQLRFRIKVVGMDDQFIILVALHFIKITIK